MKALIKKILQFVLGYQNYLFIFSLFTIYTLRWKKDEGDFMYMLTLLPDRGLILDVGANIGIMTVHFGRTFPDSAIYAFEPDPLNIKALRRVIRFFRLKNITVTETALAKQTPHDRFHSRDLYSRAPDGENGNGSDLPR